MDDPVKAAAFTKDPEWAFWIETVNPSWLEIAAASQAFDAVVFDMEHGVIDDRSADDLVARARLLGLRTYVRVEAPERVAIQRALDAGADGVILPQILNLDHARDVCSYAKYPPRGTRGLGYNRTMFAGMSADFVSAENQRIACFPMIETVGALNDATAIAQLSTVDGLFIGPSDLSLARGRGLFQASESDFEDFSVVVAAAKAAGKRWGMPATRPDTIAYATGQSASLIVIADDLSALQQGLLRAASLKPVKS
jgi:4-hydroxy-2-oxoheptanedioate aldolase